MKKLGQLTKVDLRAYWKREDTGFTPWLAEGDNIQLLGEAIGLELEVETTEQGVGPFRADVFCKDQNGFAVLIENQLERTDHSHLGQLLTYAAGLDAVSIVWIAATFTEEHRAALDWLNEQTGSRINFFGLEIELWQIGNSEAAPKFNVVCKPNDWARHVKNTVEGVGLTENQKRQLAYWASFKEYQSNKNSKNQIGKPAAWAYARVSIGRTGFYLMPSVKMLEDQVSISLVMDDENAKSFFKQMYQQKKAIESAIGAPLEWRELPDYKSSYIVLAEKTDLGESSQWNAGFEWLDQSIQKFHETFAGRIKKLEANTQM